MTVCVFKEYWDLQCIVTHFVHTSSHYICSSFKFHFSGIFSLFYSFSISLICFHIFSVSPLSSISLIRQSVLFSFSNFLRSLLFFSAPIFLVFSFLFASLVVSSYLIFVPLFVSSSLLIN